MVQRETQGYDNEVLEELNRAPHPMVADMRCGSTGFRPVLASETMTATTRDILHLHHEAFRAAVRLVPGFNSAVLRNLADAATAGFIVDFYGNFGGHVPAVWYFRKGKMAEDA